MDRRVSNQPEKTIKIDSIAPIIIVIIIIIGILSYYIYIALTRFSTSTQGTSFLSSQLYVQCNPGDCATDILLGEKRCPSKSTDIILANPESEVCNPKFSCTNVKTPYALKNDGSVNTFGVCDSGVICRCVNKYSCPYYTQVLFHAVDGTFLSSSNTDILKVEQIATGNVGDFGIDNFTFPNQSTYACAVSWQRLGNLMPLNCPITFRTDPVLDLLYCFNLNPCEVGRLAIITNQDPNTWTPTRSNLSSAIVACVPGDNNSCYGSYPIWDPDNLTVLCRNASPVV